MDAVETDNVTATIRWRQSLSLGIVVAQLSTSLSASVSMSMFPLSQRDTLTSAKIRIKTPSPL